MGGGGKQGLQVGRGMGGQLSLLSTVLYMYRRESNLAISSSPVKNNNVLLLFRRTATV